MLVSQKNLLGVIERLSSCTEYAVDVESTGLRAYHGDYLFSLIIAVEDESYYFNFGFYHGYEDFILPREETFLLLKPILENPLATYFIFNAKFDMSMLYRDGISITGSIHDPMVVARILYNRHLDYSLDAVAKRYGFEKSKEVDSYIAKHKLFTIIQSPGKSKAEKQLHFDRVPFEIISKYGEQDGRITFDIGKLQQKELEQIPKDLGTPSLKPLFDLEAEIVKVCLDMERIGIKIDRKFCETAYKFEIYQAEKAAKEFSNKTGKEFIDSNKYLAWAFTEAGEAYPTTEKGNPSFTDEVLEGFTSPLAKMLQTYRKANKRAHTYFANFLHYADTNDRIHANFRQSGTDTLRFSISAPSLQNCSKDDDSSFPVRAAFVPTKGFFFAMLDYQQIEFRVMLDYARELPVIRQIMNEGLDVHTATAKSVSVDRNSAKTLNFLLIYGGGAGKLAKALSISEAKGKDLKEKYFEKLPAVSTLIKTVAERAERRGFIYNWYGALCHFPRLVNPRNGRLDRFAYKAPNHLIQGSCAMIIKIAMVKVHEYLKDKRSRMVLTVHDELFFEVHNDEAYVIPVLQKIMVEAYPPRVLPMAVDIEVSTKSWHDKEEFTP